MTPLNTIIEEEVDNLFDTEYITGKQPNLTKENVTSAIQRAYEAGVKERDTYWKERVRKKFIPWEKIEILDNGAIMTIDNKVRLYGFKRMTDPLMYEYDLRKGNQALDTLLDNLK